MIEHYAFGIFLLLAIGFANTAAAAQVTAARLWPSQEYSRVTLEASGPIAYRMFTIPDPVRLVLDLELLDSSTALEALPKIVPPDDKFIRGVRIGRFKPGTLRLVFDMKSEVRPEVFLLKPVGEYGYRLVLDVYSIDSEDPIVALIRNVERERQSESGPQPTPGNDPISAPTEPANSTATSVRSNEVTDPKVPATAAATDTAKPVALSDDDAKAAASARSPGRRVIIAIDAGHGGEDPGASGREGNLEKNVTLAIARRLKARIDDEPGMRAVLIRDGDYFIPLHLRVAKARAVKADAFVSIHADSFIKPHARGSSVFALSERGATSAAARWIAKRENEADLVGGVNIDVADPYLKKVLLDLSQTATINDSLMLARAVLDELGEINTLHKSHVEQAGFAVLKSPDIPSILVETAFISNPEEEKRLTDDAYQEKLSGAIFMGLKRFLARQPGVARSMAARADAIPSASVEPVTPAVVPHRSGGLHPVADVDEQRRAAAVPAVHVVTEPLSDRLVVRNDGVRIARAATEHVESRTVRSASTLRARETRNGSSRAHRSTTANIDRAKHKTVVGSKSKIKIDVDCKSSKKLKAGTKCVRNSTSTKRRLASR